MNVSHPIPLWLRCWSWLIVLTALPLVIIGAEVTTKKVGMADPVGLRNPLYLFEREADVSGQPIRIAHLLETGQWGLLIEHGHRLLGWLVGLECIIFAIAMGFLARGRSRWLGLVAGLVVAAQGILGILRVTLNLKAGPELSTLHGCTAQLVFASLVAIAVMASVSWRKPNHAIPSWIRRLAVALCCLVYLQMVFGAIMRHLLDPLAQRLHILLAFAAVLGIIWLAVRARQLDTIGATTWLSLGLMLVVCLQPVLGVEAWIRRFGSLMLPDAVPSTLMGDLVRSGHHVLGTLIFAGTIALTVLLCRPRAEAATPSALHRRAMEGIA